MLCSSFVLKRKGEQGAEDEDRLSERVADRDSPIRENPSGSAPLSSESVRGDISNAFDRARRDEATLELEPSAYLDDLAGFDLADDLKEEFLGLVISIMRTFVENGWDVRHVGAWLDGAGQPNATGEDEQ
jgi:hypothetical protein